MTLHFFDEKWGLKSVPAAILSTGSALKSAEQVCCIMEGVLPDNSVIDSDRIRGHAYTSDQEVSVALSYDPLTNFFGSVSCVVQTIAWLLKTYL